MQSDQHSNLPGFEESGKATVMETGDPSFSGWVSWGGQDRKGVPGKGGNKLQVLFICHGDSWLNSEGWERIYRQDRKSNLGRGSRENL